MLNQGRDAEDLTRLIRQSQDIAGNADDDPTLSHELWRFFAVPRTEKIKHPLPFIFRCIFQQSGALTFETIVNMHDVAMRYFPHAGRGGVRRKSIGRVVLDKSCTADGISELLQEFSVDKTFMVNGMFINKKTLEKMLRKKYVRYARQFAKDYP